LVLHACLRIARALHITPEGDNTIAHTPAISTANVIADVLSTGRQLCSGKYPPTTHEKVAALMMIGEPFRSKDWASNKRRSCDAGSMEVQRMLAKNTHEHLINPLEADGFRVDVFLAENNCTESEPWHPGLHEWIPRVVYDNGSTMADLKREGYQKELKAMYGIHRVVSIVSMDAARNQFFHMGQMMNHVKNHEISQRFGYRFLIVLRYDVKLLFSLAEIYSTMANVTQKNTMSNAATPSSPGLDLNSLMVGEDFFFAFPGGLNNCMSQLFNQCLAPCKFMDCDPGQHHRIDKVTFDEMERNPKCYEFGPLVLDTYTPRRGGYVSALMAFRQALVRLGPYYAKQGEVHGGQQFTWKDGVEHCSSGCGSLVPERPAGYNPSYMTLTFHIQTHA
jgi:hypothetical protein